MKGRKKDYGRGSRKLFRALLAASLLLLLALPQLGAWPISQAGGKEDLSAVSAPTAMMEEPTAEEPLQSKPSGTASNLISEEQLNSLEKAQEGRKLNGSESLELYFLLDETKAQVAVARKASEAKDAEIADLKSRLAEAEEETGSKAYLMLDGTVGFEELLPQFGVGLTIGTRIGNSLMAELGADYMLGGIGNIKPFSLDRFQFRAGIGWMF